MSPRRRLPSDGALAYASGVLRSKSTVALVVLTLTRFGFLACGGGPEPKMVAAKDDGVPVNSAAEERLDGGPKARPAAAANEADAQPITTPMSGEGSTKAPSATPAMAVGGKAAPKASPAGKEPPPAKGGDAKVTKTECKRLFDRYIDLTIGSDARFAGVPPEMVAQMKASAKAQAQAQKGDPCATQEVSRAQYTCAIASTSTAAWTRCMK